MSKSDLEKGKTHQEQELRVQRQISFASELFQGDVTVRTLLESLAEGVVVIDNSGVILLVNTAAEQMFGYQTKELIGKPQAVLIPERFRKVHEEHEAHFFADPRIRPTNQHLAIAGLRRDGSEFPVEISLNYIETINGVLALAFITDITLRKQYESHLRESEELFRIQVECVKDYAVFMLDTAGNVLNWNVGAERLKGYKEKEIIGAHFSCFYPEEERNAGKPEEELKKAAAEGRIAYEGWRVGKDGGRFWADVIITALYDESGNLRGFSKVTHDITGRKKTGDALRFSEARYRALYCDNPTMIVTLDADLTMLSVNPFCASQLGYTTNELKGQSVLKMFHEDDRPAVAEQMRRCLQNSNQVNRWQFRKIRKDGSLLWVEETAQAVHDLNGALNLLVVCQDISDRKRAEEEIERLNVSLAARAVDLEYANRELEAFNYTVAHDLRNPLNVISSYCQILKELCSDKLDEQCKSYLQETYDGTLRMNRLIEALLNFSRLTHAELNRHRVDLSSMAREVAGELKGTEAARRVKIRITDGIVANGDAILLRVVLTNLLDNAWKYTATREEAVIEFGAKDIDGKPVYFVRDNGSGFDNTAAEKIFAPFQRLPGAEGCRGFGIGLATVERIIRRHGGRVCAEGEQGKGATFYFTLQAHMMEQPEK